MSRRDRRGGVRGRAWLTIVTLSIGLFMVVIDGTALSVALPDIDRDLGAGLAGAQWIVDAYMLTYAVLLLTGGRVADIVGSRRTFLAGLAVFTAASLACGFAATTAELVAARAAQGAGAALLAPATISLIAASFPPSRRGLAYGVYSSVSAVAIAIGPLAGGFITERLQWNWIFFVNVPIGLAALVVARTIPAEGPAGQREAPDLLGLATSGVAIFSVVYALIELDRYGWSSPRIVAILAVGVVSAVAFVRVERRQDAPMLDVSLLRNSTFSGANATLVLAAIANLGTIVFVSAFMQTVLGYSPIQAGLAFVPVTLISVIAPPIAGRAADVVGPRWLMVFGMTVLSASLYLYSGLDAHSTYGDVLVALAVGSVGLGVAITPLTIAVMNSAPPGRAGIAGGVLNCSRQVGGAIGIALLGAIIGSRIGSAGLRDPGYAAGFRLAFHVSAAIALVGAAVAAMTVRTGPGELRRAVVDAEASAA